MDQPNKVDGDGAALLCPACRIPLYRADSWRCNACGTSYKSEGIVDLIPGSKARSALEDADYDARAGYGDEQLLKIGHEWLAVAKQVGLTLNGKSILELGAGTGALTIALLRGSEINHAYATDISSTFLRHLLKRAGSDSRLTAVRCDCNELPVRESSIDVVFGRSILHHLLDYDTVVKQVEKILRPGGAAIFFEPIIDGKLVIALYASLIFELSADDQRSGGLTSLDRTTLQKTVRHITKSRWLPQDRDTLAKLEDKYIFDLEGLSAVGRDAGFRSVRVVNGTRQVDSSYWSNFIATLRVLGLEPKKFEPYRFVAESYANTFGLFDRYSRPPMAYFCFLK